MNVSIQPLPLVVSLLLVGCSHVISAAYATQADGPIGKNTCAANGIFAESECEDDEHHVHLMQTNLVLTGDRPPIQRHGNHVSRARASSNATALDNLSQLLKQIQRDDTEHFDETLGALVDHPILAQSLDFNYLTLHNDGEALANSSRGQNSSEVANSIARRTWSAVDKHRIEIAQRAADNYVRNLAANTGPYDPMQAFWMMVNLDESQCNPWYFVAVVCMYTLACIIVEFNWQTTLHETGSNRSNEWDLCKFIFVGGVVYAHSLVFVKRLVGKHDMYEMWTGCWVMTPSVMPGLVFISGVFSQSMSRRSLALTFLGLPCTQILFDLALSLETYLTPGFSVFQIGRSGVEWYLECMFVWRLGIAPVFVFARKIGMPVWVVYVLFYLASYVPWYLLPYDTNHLLPEISALMAGLNSVYPWRFLVMYGPFFSLGLVKTPEEWNAIFRHPVTIWTSVIVYIAYIILIPTSNGFRTIFDTSCSIKGQCKTVWWPMSLATNEGLGIHSLRIYTWVYVQRVIMTLTAVSIGFGALVPMKQYTPRFATLVISFGSRTFYSYLLNWLLWVMPASRLGFALWLSKQPLTPPPWWRIVCFWLSCWVLHCVLSCRLTEVLFQWLFQMPVWIASCFGVRFDSHRDTEKPVAKTAGAPPTSATACVVAAAAPAAAKLPLFPPPP